MYKHTSDHRTNGRERRRWRRGGGEGEVRVREAETERRRRRRERELSTLSPLHAGIASLFLLGESEKTSDKEVIR